MRTRIEVGSEAGVVTAVSPGPYVLSVWTRRPFDGTRHAEDMSELLPYIVLKRSHRYKAAERRAAEQEQSRPHYVLSLTPTQQDGLAGGFLRV